jgi:hypothetical protein
MGLPKTKKPVMDADMMSKSNIKIGAIDSGIFAKNDLLESSRVMARIYARTPSAFRKLREANSDFFIE